MPMDHTLMSRSNIKLAIEPSKMPKKQIQAVTESSAGYIFNVKDYNPQSTVQDDTHQYKNIFILNFCLDKMRINIIFF